MKSYAIIQIPEDYEIEKYVLEKQIVVAEIISATIYEENTQIIYGLDSRLELMSDPLCKFTLTSLTQANSKVASPFQLEKSLTDYQRAFKLTVRNRAFFHDTCTEREYDLINYDHHNQLAGDNKKSRFRLISYTLSPTLYACLQQALT